MDSECDDALLLSKSWKLKLLLLLKCAVCIVAIVGNLYLLFKRSVNWLGHPNAKFLLSSHLFFTIGVAMAFGLTHFIDIIRLSVDHEDPCDYMVPIWLPLSIRPLAAIFIYAQIWSMFAIAVERSIATFYMKSYEKTKSKKYSVIFIIITIVFSHVFGYYMIVYGNDFDLKVASMVSKTKQNAQRFQLLITLECIPESLTFILFHIVLWKNSNKVGSVTSLSNKYQIRENRKIALLLLPIIYLHTIIFILVSFGLSFIIKISPRMDSVEFAIANEIISATVFYCAILPLFIQWRIERKKQLDAEDLKSHGGNYFLSIDQIAHNSNRFNTKREISIMNAINGCLFCK